MTIEERDRLALDNDGFVYVTARRWFGVIAGYDSYDIVQEARLETLRRVQRWDAGRAKITTFLRTVIDRHLGRIKHENELAVAKCSKGYGAAVGRIRMGLATAADYTTGKYRRVVDTRRRCLHRDAAMKRTTLSRIERMVVNRKDGKY